MHIGCADALGFELALIVEHVSHHHGCAIGNKTFSDGQANATGSASDDGDAIIEFQSLLLISSILW